MTIFENIQWDVLAARALITILILLIFWLVVRIVQRMVIPRINKIVQRTESDIDDIIVGALKLPYRLLIIAVVLFIIISVMQPSPSISNFTMHVVRTLIVISIIAVIYNSISLVMRSALLVERITGINIDDQLLPFFRTALQAVIVAMGALIIMQEWEYDVAGLVAGLGVTGLMFALAAEDTVANIFGFTTIVGDRPLAIGEYIITPDVSGVVEEVGWRSTRVRQLDQAIVTIPNNMLANSVVTNWSRLEKRRMDMTIGVTYDATSAQIRALLGQLEELLKANEDIDEESVTVLFTNFGASSLDVRMIAMLQLAAWGDFMTAQQNIMLQVMDLVESLGLGFAFPSQSLYIEKGVPGQVDPSLMAQLEQTFPEAAEKAE